MKTAYLEISLKSELFANDVVTALKPYLKSDPEVRIYEIFQSQ